MTTSSPDPRLRLACVVLATCGYAYVASAQSRPEVPLAPKAQEHLDRGMAAYAAKDYDRALEELQQAYALDPRPHLVYAQAQALRMAGRCPEAIEMYRRFLDLRPAPNEAAKAERHIARCGETARPAGKPSGDDSAQLGTSTSPPVSYAPWYADGVGLALVSTGVAGAATGAWFFARASSSEDAARSAPDYPAFLRFVEEADRRRVVGWVAIAAGGAILGLGIWKLAVRSRESSAVSIRLSVSPQLAGIAGEF